LVLNFYYIPPAAVLPSFVAIAKTFAGAPPGFRSNTIMSSSFFSVGVKSINSSPSATISNFFFLHKISPYNNTILAFFIDNI
jgi:hypothetical protein